MIIGGDDGDNGTDLLRTCSEALICDKGFFSTVRYYLSFLLASQLLDFVVSCGQSYFFFDAEK